MEESEDIDHSENETPDEGHSGPGTQAEMLKDPKWNGVPPVGNNPIHNKSKFVGLILIVYLISLTIWAAYRIIGGQLPMLADPVTKYWVDLFGKLILQLVPLYILWRLLFKEHGHPFRLTKTNLPSAVIWGCLGGLLFYIVASIVFVGHLEIIGEGRDFHLVGGWTAAGVGWGLVIATGFSFMLSTGPAEELVSRGFFQDQLGRVLNLPVSIGISAVLFAAAHLPISLLYLWEGKLTVPAILWYMPTLAVMGVFFSLVYFWSRNIVLGIIIHGLWDWFLSIWIVKGAYSNSILEDPSAAFGSMDLVNTIITAAIMLPFFYLLYRLFWKRSARETDPKPWKAVTASKEFFFPLRWLTAPVRWLYEHIRWTRRADRGEVFKYPWVFCFAFTALFCLAMLPLGSAFETDNPEQQKDRRFEPIYETITDTVNESASGNLYEDTYTDITIRVQEGWLDSVNATLAWVDEAPSNSRYTNAPDTFTLSFIGPGTTEVGSQTGESGSLALAWSATSKTNTTLTVRITMVEAGDSEPPFFNPGGKFTEADNGNTYSLTYTYTTSYEQLVEEEDYNIRW